VQNTNVITGLLIRYTAAISKFGKGRDTIQEQRRCQYFPEILKTFKSAKCRSVIFHLDLAPLASILETRIHSKAFRQTNDM
jgi:hypothetical protein